MVVKFQDSSVWKLLQLTHEKFEAFEPKQALRNHYNEAEKFVSELPEEKFDYRYENGKWDLANVIGHLIDHHTIFLSRIIAISRGDSGELPGFDEKFWAKNSYYEYLDPFKIKRLYCSSLQNFVDHAEAIPERTYGNLGIANNIEININEYFFYFTNHEKHHFEVIKTKYLS